MWIQFFCKITSKWTHCHHSWREETHKCNSCESSFFLKSSLRLHILSVHEAKKPHKCNSCESSYEYIATIHEGKKPYKCSMCESKFWKRNDLKKNMFQVSKMKIASQLPYFKTNMTHLKNHKCSLCNSCFSKKGRSDKYFASLFLVSWKKHW